MDRIVILLALVLSSQAYAADGTSSLSESGSSNTSYGSSLHISPVAGLANMSIKGSDTNTNSDNGLSAGGLMDLGSGPVQFETGLLYNQFGAKSSFSGNQLNLSYLSIPLLAKFNLTGNPEATAFLQVGLMPGFLVSKEIKFSDGGSSTTLNVNSFDLPAVAGIGGAIPTGHGTSVILEANYVRGLTKVNSTGDSSVRNEGFLVLAGFAFAL